ncbi:SoxW family protein [Ruegeria marina]|uniref:Thioredoxin-related protein n=1 Tax=Ruegeria marina TaxID=639004 RepID=A0A1G6RZJ1_9RHOB|nr:thioredoxin family protein [Ruegeria marina]SDD09821.1 Thioredoxin-related protein [Ruegeria marina]
MRRLLAAILALGLATAAHAVEMGDDGLHKPEWLRDTFKDLREDYAEAQSEGKRLLLLVEQRGCLYCRDMHENTFTDPRVLALLEETYFPVQINLHGDIEIVDTDGETLTEKEATRKWRVLFTPTMIFLPPVLEESVSAVDQAVSVMPGAFSAGTTLDMMTWVKEERYLDQSEEDFQRYHARMIKERNDGDTR